MENQKSIYAHEHTTIDLSGVKKSDDCRLDNQAGVIEEFNQLHALGVTKIIDQTNRGMGRNPEYVAEVAQKTGIDIVQATGYYKEPFLPEECYSLSEQELSEIMVKELTQGIDQTGIKAALIGEIGTSNQCIEPMEEKIFKAAARAHAETGAPICTHTTLGTMGAEQVDLFKSFGVYLSKVVLSHIDLSGNLEYMLSLLDTGTNIAFDTIGKNNYQPDDDRVLWLSEICKRGYSNQIVLSVDITRKSHYKAHGGIGYAYLLENFVPKLEAAGISQEDLKNMLYENAYRIYQ